MDCLPLARDAAKLLEISGSDETTAYEEALETVEVVEVVRARS
jgi:hypothetical protein